MNWFLVCTLPFTYPALFYKEIWILYNNGTSLWNFVPNSGLRKFCHNETCRLSGLFTTSATVGALCMAVHYSLVSHCAIMLICCGFVIRLVTTVVQQLTRFQLTRCVTWSIYHSRFSCMPLPPILLVCLGHCFFYLSVCTCVSKQRQLSTAAISDCQLYFCLHYCNKY